jgi:hypothetical protein
VYLIEAVRSVRTEDEIQAADVADRRRNGRRRRQFFSSATEGRRHCVVTLQALGLNAMRFAELSNRHCAVAQERRGHGGVWLTSVSPATTWR